MTNRGVRIRGAVLIVLGIGLAGFMVWLLGEIGPEVSGRGEPDVRFTGTAEDGRLITNVLTGVLAFGVVFGLYGLFMTATGKESRAMKILAGALFAVMIGASLIFSNPGQMIADLF